MALERFIPKSPDPFIRNSQDFEVAKFGHLNTIIEYINSYVVTDSLQLAGSGPITSTARYITDALGNNSAISISTIRVGIGTNTPISELTINGTTASGFGITLTDGANARGHLLATNGGTFLQGWSNGLYLGTTSVSDAIKIDWQGFVGMGIGANAPLARTHIKGSGSTSATIALLVQNSGGTNILRVKDNGDTNIGAAGAYNEITGNYLSLYIPSIIFQNSHTYIYGGTSVATAMSWNFGDSVAGTARVQIKGTGSTSATKTLQLQDSSGNGTFAFYDDGSAIYGRSGSAGIHSFYSNAGLAMRVSGTQLEVPQVVSTYQNQTIYFYLRSNNGQGITFEHNNSQQSNVTGVAMVNIGGGYFTQQGCQFSSLQIAPIYDLNSNTNTSSIARGIYYNPTITNLRVAQHRAIETVTGDVLFGTTSGNVGIGTTNPGVKLQITQAAGSSVAISTIATSNYNLVVQNTTDLAGTYCGIGFSNPYDTQGYIGVSQTGTGYGAGGNMLFALRPSGGGTVMTEYMRLTSAGSLGIGTTSPTAKTHIVGSGSTSATTSLLVQNSSGNTALQVTDDKKIGVGNTIYQSFSSSVNNVLLSTHTTSTINDTGIYAPGGNAFGVSVAGTRKVYVSSHWQFNGGICAQPDGTGASLDNSAILEAYSTTKGFLPPRMTTAQKNAISTPAAGLVVYDTDLNKLCVYTTAWQTITSV